MANTQTGTETGIQCGSWQKEKYVENSSNSQSSFMLNYEASLAASLKINLAKKA